ncbi:DsbA family protein [Salinarimonas rosea]|uniref:DsbA family protein n=1 Tax=Salinarimonas rosea TaxID=552063 RepID=UPI00041D8DF1|nr:DsbA family protein [Salinarimonas rosea]
MPTRRTALAGLLAAAAPSLSTPLLAPPARAQEAVAPHRIPTELAEHARTRPALVPVGDVGGDVVFVEFFDYNCPWCRASADHLDALAAMAGVGVLLASYPILSDASREAAAIALGVLAHAGPEVYRGFHASLFSARGLKDGTRALAVAEEAGLDVDAVGRAAALPGIAPALEDMIGVGRRLGFDATPATLVGPWAWEGYIDLATKRRIIADLRA